MPPGGVGSSKRAYKFKNLNMKTTLKLKINSIMEYLGLIIPPIKPSAGLLFLIKSREAIPLTLGGIITGVGTVYNSCC
jgi:hypothetical protein